MKGIDFIRLSIIGAIVLLAMSIVIRIVPPPIRLVLFFATLGMLVWYGVLLFGRGWRERRRQKAHARTTEGQIERHLRECADQINRHEAEKERIQASLRELRVQLRKAADLSDGMAGETQRLIQGFEQELKLRTTKITFFRDCAAKLEGLLQQHRLLKDLDSKKQELEGLRERHYDDVADMENLRWQVEREGVYLDTLEELSLRMQRSDELDDVIHLQGELDQMTRELGNQS